MKAKIKYEYKASIKMGTRTHTGILVFDNGGFSDPPLWSWTFNADGGDLLPIGTTGHIYNYRIDATKSALEHGITVEGE